MKKVLWVCPRWLNPINDGARQATHSLLMSTTDVEFQKLVFNTQGIEVDLLIWAEKRLTPLQIKDEAARLQKLYGLKNVFVETRNLIFLPSFLRKIIFTLGSFIFLKPMSVLAFFSIKWCLRSCFGLRYDCLVFDAPHGAISFFPLRFKNKQTLTDFKMLLRAHNLETQIWKAEIKRHFGLIKWIITFQCCLMKRFEQGVVKSASAVVCVSESDSRLFRRLFKSVKTATIPIGYNFNTKIEVQKISSWHNTWGFLARLDWPPNCEGLCWFLKEVWPRVVVQKDDLFLVIAGSGVCDPHLKKLIGSSKNTLFLGPIDNKEDFYRRIDGVIIPIFYGGGTRVKAIEAVQNRKLILSTRLGVHGLQLGAQRDYFQAENVQQWQQHLLQNLNQEVVHPMTKSAFIKLKAQFDPHFFYKRWFELF